MKNEIQKSIEYCRQYIKAGNHDMVEKWLNELEKTLQSAMDDGCDYTPQKKVMSHIQKALELAPNAGLYLQIKVTEQPPKKGE